MSVKLCLSVCRHPKFDKIAVIVKHNISNYFETIMFVYLDTETTGLSASRGAKIVEIAILDEVGDILLNTLVDPLCKIPWQASNVHGIKDSMVKNAPTLDDLLPEIDDLISGNELVIYNSTFDTQFFDDGLAEAAEIHCAMRAFSVCVGSQRWVKLTDAARYIGHRWSGNAHRALADTQACRKVWEWVLEN